MTLIHGDCLVEMTKLKDDSIDLLFCDLPYNQTSCHWDCAIDLVKFWKEVNRICKDTTPMFFTCSTKFGVSLINSNPKNFRYDMVWVKSAPCGFLNAKKMPMKKHEMVYVFYRKLPMYDLSSHKHKFLKEIHGSRGASCYKKIDETTTTLSSYEPSLPVSVLREVKLTEESLYGVIHRPDFMARQSESNYEPALPTTVLNCESKVKKTRKTPKLEEGYGKEYLDKKPNYREINPNLGANGTDCHIYEPALPTTVLRETCESMYGTEKGKVRYYDKNGKLRDNEPRYEPALPTTVLRQSTDTECYDGNITYNYEDRDGAIYEPPLPNTILEIKSEKGKHATQKPTALIEWCLKYYSKEGDTVLDPTMGSGSTGVACKNMNRQFIGIEMDKAIYDIAKGRV